MQAWTRRPILGRVKIVQVELSDTAAPASDEVKIWTVPLDGPDPTARRVQARAELHRVLGGCLGIAAETVRFDEHRGGKPRLPGDELEFNLTHSGAWAMFAISVAAPVGIDLERPRTFTSPERLTRLVERLCSPAERDAINQARDPADALLRLWVRKEAVVKATGQGVGAGERLPALDVLGEHADGHVLSDLRAPGAGYHAALAVAATT
jgi:phosphopantetheine--protein transferase-like protein